MRCEGSTPQMGDWLHGSIEIARAQCNPLPTQGQGMVAPDWTNGQPADPDPGIAFWPFVGYNWHMKEIALADAKNNLSALIAEIEATGEEVIVTRHGKPAIRLAPIRGSVSQDDRRALGRYLIERMDSLARDHPAATETMDWAALKRLMEEGRE